MKVILQEKIKGLGNPGDIKEVADGYARNYLLPRGLAVEASAENLNQAKQQHAKKQRQAERELRDAEALKAKLDGKEVRLAVRSGEGGKLFGSVTSQDVAEAIAAQLGISLDKRKIVLEEPLKSLGRYSVNVKLHPQVQAQVHVAVAAEQKR